MSGYVKSCHIMSCHVRFESGRGPPRGRWRSSIQSTVRGSKMSGGTLRSSDPKIVFGGFWFFGSGNRKWGGFLVLRRRASRIGRFLILRIRKNEEPPPHLRRTSRSSSIFNSRRWRNPPPSSIFGFEERRFRFHHQSSIFGPEERSTPCPIVDLRPRRSDRR